MFWLVTHALLPLYFVGMHELVSVFGLSIKIAHPIDTLHVGKTFFSKYIQPNKVAKIALEKMPVDHMATMT